MRFPRETPAHRILGELGYLVVSLRGVKATKQSPKLLLRGLPRADALAMTTFSAIAFVQNFEFIVKRTSILALAISLQNTLIPEAHQEIKPNWAWVLGL
jgi:hypothetical protein